MKGAILTGITVIFSLIQPIAPDKAKAEGVVVFGESYVCRCKPVGGKHAKVQKFISVEESSEEETEGNNEE